jgi:hypothetical protein
MTMEFQTLLGPVPNRLFDVTMKAITAAEIHEPGGSPAPSTVMHINQAFNIDIQWDVTGALANAIGGWWDLHAYLEKMGTGPDLDLTDQADHIIELQAGPIPHHYHRQFDVPVAKVTNEGAYKLFVTVTYRNRMNVPDQMAGYWEGPILQFYP